MQEIPCVAENGTHTRQKKMGKFNSDITPGQAWGGSLLFMSPMRAQETRSENGAPDPYYKQLSPLLALPLTPIHLRYMPAFRKEVFQLSTSSCVLQAISSCR